MKMNAKPLTELSRRERQIMEIIYQRGQATAAEVQLGLADPPSYSAVRALLAILVKKKWLKIKKEGVRYIYLPKDSSPETGRSAIQRVVDTFFSGSLEKAVAALLDGEKGPLSDAERKRMKALIDQARRKGE
jgi:predicted transcriptional regulator